MTEPNGTLLTLTSTFAVNEMFSCLIHGFAKAGKSTVTSTAPQPILVLDAEGSWRFVDLRKVYWNPLVDAAPPVYDGTWDVCMVTVRDWQTVEAVYGWLTRYQLPFVTVVLDSITEMQRRLKANLVGTEAMKMQDWGVLLTKMDATIRGFRDLTLVPGLNVRCVLFVAETRREDGPGGAKWRPYMQGQISTSLPYWVDVCGYLYAEQTVDGNGQPTGLARRLLVSPGVPMFEAGERVQGRLGAVWPIVDTPTIGVGADVTTMMHTIYRHGTSVPATQS